MKKNKDEYKNIIRRMKTKQSTDEKKGKVMY